MEAQGRLTTQGSPGGSPARRQAGDLPAAHAEAHVSTAGTRGPAVTPDFWLVKPTPPHRQVNPDA